MPKISCDQEAEIITIQVSNKRSVDSDVQDNVVVDYDKKGEITKIEIMNVSFNEFKKSERKLENFLIVEKNKSGAGNFVISR